MQPDRKHAQSDDAAVEVAAHRFFVSLSRLAPRERQVAAVVKSWCAVAFDPNCSSSSHLRAPRVCKAGAAAWYLAFAMRRGSQKPQQPLPCVASVLQSASVSQLRLLAAFPRQPPPCREKQRALQHHRCQPALFSGFWRRRSASAGAWPPRAPTC